LICTTNYAKNAGPLIGISNSWWVSNSILLINFFIFFVAFATVLGSNKILGDSNMINKEFVLSVSMTTKLIGSLLSIVLVDLKGRIFFIRLSTLLFLVGAGLATAAPQWSILLSGRILMGLRLGMSTAAPQWSSPLRYCCFCYQNFSHLYNFKFHPNHPSVN
jgi:MFS family permease